MLLPKHILVPTDLSEGAEYALAYACDLASKLDAELHLVNVIGIPVTGIPELGAALTTSVIDSLVAENKKALDTIAEAHRKHVRLGKVLLKTGDPRDVINHCAAELGAELIVMGTHGRRGVKRALLGSVAESVVRTAPCPVLTVRYREEKYSRRHAA